MSVAFDLLRVLATLASVLLYVSPYPDFRRIHRQRSTGEISLLPVVMLFCNAYMWCVYGCVADSIFPLVVVNLVGVVTSVLFSAVYYRWSSSEQRAAVRKLWGSAALAMALATTYAVVGVYGFTNQSPTEVAVMLGFVCVTCNICLFASPLETMGKVVRTKSASSLPITLCTVNLVAGALWSAMAIGQNDMFVLTPNALGTVLSALQVSLYVKYPPHPETQAQIVFPGASLEEGRSRPLPIVTSISKLKHGVASGSLEFRPVRVMMSPLISTNRAEASPLLASEFPSSPFAGSYGSRSVVVTA
ncbi:hypothetical protein BBJ28_00006694 [Nothophytophthora sp. Chile5]|nr:hypothetical protein BBJ28_00006694 [Nothophytophthora sp. Chile5]